MKTLWLRPDLTPAFWGNRRGFESEPEAAALVRIEGAPPPTSPLAVWTAPVDGSYDPAVHTNPWDNSAKVSRDAIRAKRRELRKWQEQDLLDALEKFLRAQAPTDPEIVATLAVGDTLRAELLALQQ